VRQRKHSAWLKWSNSLYLDHSSRKSLVRSHLDISDWLHFTIHTEILVHLYRTQGTGAASTLRPPDYYIFKYWSQGGK
jgi:hypothetical protein